MKILRRALIPVLLITLLLTITACGGNEKKIVGIWSTKVNMTESVDLGEDFADFDSELKMKMLFEFKSDGTYEISLDEDDAKKAMESWLDDFVDYAKVWAASEAEELGITYDEFSDLYEQQNGSPFEEDMETQIAGEIDIDALVKDSKSSGKYKVEDDKLYTAEDDEDYVNSDYDVIKIAGDVLTFVSTTDPDYDEDNELFKYPMELTKVK